ncbi:TPA: hypothetical protein ACTR19_004637, partial [Yersinia enterocolitica]|uniref:hypothetical protein n=1 Tax=Yersinia enterocolitica TaxID=630 RepID=UPI0037051D2B
MLSKDKLKYPTEITDEQLRYLITAFENNMAEFYPVGREAEIARQLLSLREQIAELKAVEPFKYTVVGGDGEDIGTTKSLSDAEYMAIRYGGNVVPLFTAAKPAED